MNSDAVYTQLTPIFHDVFDDEGLQLTPQLSADDVDDWDSLMHVRLILAIEQKFGIKFSAAEVGRLKNVGDLVQLIAAKTS
ncbi:MAG: acyl carrier protein [Steroidobacteraceae bacterium]